VTEASRAFSRGIVVDLNSDANASVGNLTLIGAASGAGAITAANLDVQGAGAFSLTNTTLASLTSNLTGAGGTLTLTEADGFAIDVGRASTRDAVEPAT